MKELIFIIILCSSLLHVQGAGKFMRLTRPVIETQEFSEDELQEISKNLKPKIDGDTPGTIPQPVSAGRVSKSHRNPNVNLHIVSGSQATKGQFPWQVAIDIDGQSFCGGSVISERYVLTAAHCTSTARKLNLMFGAHNVDSFEKDRLSMKAKRKIVHQQWSFETVQNDISLLEVPYKITLNKMVQIIRLPTKFQADQHFINTNVVISGWGKINDEAGDISHVLNFVSLKITSMMDCLRAYGGNSVFRTSLCVKGERSKATCQGDSGGPLVYKEPDGLYTQLGIVSFGASDGCGKGYPDVFTRVSAYLGWISSNTGLAIQADRGENKTKVDVSAKPKVVDKSKKQ